MESLISRLYEAEYSLQEAGEGENGLVQGYIDSLCAVFLGYVSRLKDVLEVIQAGGGQGKGLGHHGLQLVKLVEAVVRLGNESIESALCTEVSPCSPRSPPRFPPRFLVRAPPPCADALLAGSVPHADRAVLLS